MIYARRLHYATLKSSSDKKCRTRRDALYHSQQTRSDCERARIISSKRYRRADINYKHNVHTHIYAREAWPRSSCTREYGVCLWIHVRVWGDLNDSSDKTRITRSCAPRRSNSYQSAYFFPSLFLRLPLLLLLPLLRPSAHRGEYVCVCFILLIFDFLFLSPPLSLVQARMLAILR